MRRIVGIFFLLVCFFLVSISWERAGDSAQGDQAATPSISKVQADLNFGRMPLYFIANEGQLDEQVAYYVQGKDKTLYFTPEGITIALTSSRTNGEDRSSGEPKPFK